MAYPFLSPIVKILDNLGNEILSYNNITSINTIAGQLPMIFTSNGSNLTSYEIYGNTNGVGDYDSTTQKYIIPITIFNSVSSPTSSHTIRLSLDSALTASQKITLVDTNIDIPTYSGKNLITVDTTIKPSKILIKGNIDLISMGPEVTYTITYKNYDGSAVLDTETIITTFGVKANARGYVNTTPTRTGTADLNYTFVGWSTAPNQTSRADESVFHNIQNDLTLYAAFQKTFTTDTILDSWEQIIENCNNGTYMHYQIGDLKTLDIGSQGPVQMEIVAINTDDKADNSGKAAITWISKQLLNTARRMHSSSNDYAVWSTCELRGYLRGEFFSTLPIVVQNGIKEVTKYTSQRTGATDWATHSSTETIWIPSSKEIDNTVENNGPYYSCAARTTPWRSKDHDPSSYWTSYWWLRTASTGPAYSAGCYQRVMNYDKSINTNGGWATELNKIAFGFCT